MFRSLVALVAVCLALAASPAWAVDRHQSDTIYKALTKAPDFSLPTADGAQSLGLADFKGKVRIVVFCASWSPYSRSLVAELSALRQKYQAKGVEVLAVSTEDGSTLQAYARDAGLHFPVLVADPELAIEYGGVEGYPTTFVIGRHGYIYKHYAGQWPAKALEKAIQELL